MKIGIFNSELWKKISATGGWVFGFLGALISFIDIEESIRVKMLCSFAGFMIIFFLFELIKANILWKAKLNVGESEIIIRKGDIFSNDIYENKKLIKVFAFNEYFDTKVDDSVISHGSLNGQFIDNHINDVSSLDEAIGLDKRLLTRHKLEENSTRESGKKIKYELGSIFKFSDDIFLTALTHFDSKNRAYLSIQDYIKFLVNFWDEIDELYAGKTVVITLFGSGITRLDHDRYTATEILDTILWTFKLRRIKFKKPTKLVILLDKDTNRQINYFLLRSRFYGLQK
ncbi:macro domain-containing protein [Latilactobacillus sakei]|uniref:macro domain-containing protein n=1 Tax=Latilactobacillus sakei TaxID=1599 RepID=UPI001F5173CA|nr:macro domain-containing protein [Latilactobacillus sakei]